MLWCERVLRTAGGALERRGNLSQDLVALFCCVLPRWPESLGVHALFGAFLAGIVMPRHPGLSRELSQKLEALVVVLLLPLYFALTGLRSSFFLIAGADMWFYCGAIILLAVVGKLGGSLVSTRMNGMSWRESAAGVFDEHLGLVELVILQIVLDRGILSPALFSIRF